MADDQIQTVDGLIVATDANDYAPGTLATFTALNLVSGATVTFSVSHVDPGPDGIYGTADDGLLHDLSGTTAPWSVTDGGPGDLDGIANGVIVTSWNVGLDALNQTLLLTATASDGTVASATFTDSNNSPPPPSTAGAAADLTADTTATPGGEPTTNVNGALFQV